MPDSEAEADSRFAFAVLLCSLLVTLVVAIQELAERLFSPDIAESILSAQFNSAVTPLLAIAALWLSSRDAKKYALNTRCSETAGALAAIVIVLAVAYAKPSYFGLWTGFGAIAGTLISLIIILFYLYGSKKLVAMSRTRQGRFAKRAVSVSIIVISLPSLIQHQNGLSNFGDTTYHVLDELLAPQLGAYPYSNYSPSYGAGLGLLLLPLRFLPISGEHMMTLIIVLCNFMILLIPILISAILHRLHPRMSRANVLAAFMLFYIMSGSSDSSGIVQEFAHFQRYVPALVALWATINTLLTPRGIERYRWNLLAGVALGLLVLNGPAFGATLAATLLFWLGLATLRRHVDLALFATTLFTSIASTLIYLIVIWRLAGAPSLLSYLGLAAKPFGLYQFYPVPLIGAHLILMPLAVVGVTLGIRALRNAPADNSNRQQTADLLMGVLGSWLLILLVKWLQAPGLEGLHFYLVPVFLIGGLLTRGRQFFSDWPVENRARLALAPSLLVALLPIAAVLSFPKTQDDLKRITGRHAGSTDWSSNPGRPSDGWSERALAETYDNLFKVSRDLSLQLSEGGSTVGYFGYLGHTVELLTGINNYLGIPAPESLRFGAGQTLLACLPLQQSPPDFLIVYLSDFPCPHYVRDNDHSNSRFYVFRKSE